MHLAGTVTVRAGATTVAVGGKARRLLALLAVDRQRTVPTDRVVDTLWDDSPPRRPAENVATLVSRLRAALGPEVITGGRDGYRLGPPQAVGVDLDDATGLVAQARQRLADQPPLAAAAARRALDLLGAGDVLVGEPDAVWVADVRAGTVRLLRETRHLLAEAALRTGEPHVASEVAEAAMSADRFDETALRLLMEAHRAAGEPHRALTAYDRLRTELASELGTDPAPPTRAAHAAVLQERDTPSASRPARPSADDGALAGRAGELAELRAAWSRACASEPAVVLLAGEGGIGKSRLAAELSLVVVRSGGRVLHARCYAGERSMALQPFVDALADPIDTMPAAGLRDLAGSYGPALAGLMPRLEGVLGRDTGRGSAELELRRAFEAIAQVLRGLAADRPALLVLDDLHNAGLATVEMLHYLARRLGPSRLLVLVTVRAEEGETALGTLADVTTRLDLGPLGPDAVAGLAAAAGCPEQATTIHRRTRGHTLFVVESLRGMAAGDTGPPESLQSAVLARLRRTGPATEEVLRAAAVLGSVVDPAMVAALLDLPLVQVAQRCEVATRARLLVDIDTAYEFANDLVQEVLYTTTPGPTRTAFHTRACGLLDGTPEAFAEHALAIGDGLRAAEALLRAADDAARRFAAADAEQLAGRALDAAQRCGENRLIARAFLARGHARFVRARFGEAVADQRAALGAARDAGDRTAEMRALRELGGPAALSGDHASISECTGWLRDALRIAGQCGDDRMRASTLAWLGVVATNRLRFAEALTHSRSAVAAARAAADDDALAAGLDGLKNAHAYLGELEPLREVLDELEPLLRRLGNLELLQWTVFESAFLAVGAGDWAVAASRCEEAIRINRRGGPVLHDSWFVAYQGCLARLQGRYDEASELGRGALELATRSPHRWFGPFAAAQLGTTLLETRPGGRRSDTARRPASTRPSGRVRRRTCSAVSPRSPRRRARPTCWRRPTGCWTGSTPPTARRGCSGPTAYLSVARAWLAHGRPGRARTVLAPLLSAAERHGWLPAQAAGAVVDGRAAAALGEIANARDALGRAAALGLRHGMPAVMREARAALDGCCRRATRVAAGRNGVARRAGDPRRDASPVRVFRRPLRREDNPGTPDLRSGRCAHANPTWSVRSSEVGSRSDTRCSATGSRPCCCSRRGRSCTPGSGRRRFRTSPGTSGWSLSRAGVTVGRTGRGPRRPTTTGSTSTTR